MGVPEGSQIATVAPENGTATIDVLGFDAAGEGGQAFLVVHLAGTPRIVLLPDGVEVTIGRSRSATLFVDDERVSRHHARVCRRGNDVFVVDLNSRNGTRVGGKRLSGETRLQGGDVIEAGPLRAVLAVATTAPARPAAALAPGELAAETGKAPAGGDAGLPAPADRPRDAGPGAPGHASSLQVIADPGMLAVYERCRRVAAMPLSVLITGETGVGKERIAEAIWRAGARADKPFVRLHVGALPETLVESELFGHERGAFTGADRRHRGYFEAASGGTLLLDEIGELPLGVQAKLLRVLEAGTISRVGSTEELSVDVRVLAATNRDLRAESRAGRFREDLFFRLSAFTIEIPPLRQRPAEIALFASLFAREIAAAAGRPPMAIRPAALTALERYPWPGNVRELKHVIEAAAVMAPHDIELEHLPVAMQGGATAEAATGASGGSAPGAAAPSLGASVDKVERDAIVAALNACAGNQTRAAERLGVSRRTLLYKMKRLGVKSSRVVG